MVISWIKLFVLILLLSQKHYTQRAFSILTNLNVCIGNPDGQFVALVQERGNEIKSSDGSSKSAYIDDFANVCCDGQSYPVTVRASNCEIFLVEESVNIVRIIEPPFAHYQIV